jgi:hypothetical protein
MKTYADKLLMTVSGLLFLMTASAQVEFGPISGDAALGKTSYYDYGCYGCHGFGGIGRKNLANDVSGIMFREIFSSRIYAEDLSSIRFFQRKVCPTIRQTASQTRMLWISTPIFVPLKMILLMLKIYRR